eukprot:scaffold3821_cov134-Isochrysis_galbana.AAC.13
MRSSRPSPPPPSYHPPDHCLALLPGGRPQMRYNILRLRADDQWALRATLRWLAASGYRVCRHSHPTQQGPVVPPSAGRANKRTHEVAAGAGGRAATLWRGPALECVKVRVRRLTENILGLKVSINTPPTARWRPGRALACRRRNYMPQCAAGLATHA